jgi:flagellar operon protein (TIGR03826 family)
MDVRNCARCGKLFQYLSGPPICSACKQKEEDSFQLVKAYIYEHREANMLEVSNETQVPIKLIERFLRDGRLLLTEDSPIYLKCENCGKEIKTGRFCQACSTSLSNAMRMSTNEKQKTDEPGITKVEVTERGRIHTLSRDGLK